MGQLIIFSHFAARTIVSHLDFVNAKFTWLLRKMEAGGLRKIVAGRAEKNFGISVARPDGLSKAAICRVTELPDNHNGRRTRRLKRKPLCPTEA